MLIQNFSKNKTVLSILKVNQALIESHFTNTQEAGKQFFYLRKFFNLNSSGVALLVASLLCYFSNSFSPFTTLDIAEKYDLNPLWETLFFKSISLLEKRGWLIPDEDSASNSKRYRVADCVIAAIQTDDSSILKKKSRKKVLEISPVENRIKNLYSKISSLENELNSFVWLGSR